MKINKIKVIENFKKLTIVQIFKDWLCLIHKNKKNKIKSYFKDKNVFLQKVKLNVTRIIRDIKVYIKIELSIVQMLVYKNTN